MKWRPHCHADVDCDKTWCECTFLSRKQPKKREIANSSTWYGRKEFPSFGSDFMHKAYFLIMNNRLSWRHQCAREWHIQSEIDCHTIFAMLARTKRRYNILFSISGLKSGNRIAYHMADWIYRCSLEFLFDDCLDVCVAVWRVLFWFNSVSECMLWIYVLFNEHWLPVAINEPNIHAFFVRITAILLLNTWIIIRSQHFHTVW